MKKQLLLIMCAGWLLLPTQVNSGIFLLPENTEITETDPIDLEGKFNTGGLRSVVDPIIAQKQGNVIYITFIKQLGDILIALTDSENNQVYNVTVNTSVQQELIIPLSGLPEGVYTITFSNEKGMMYGDFEI
ncbi:DUF3244 domain-containing protein [Parabacteroides sp. Marseille-P3160]|uniref:DUF3244 domain-containing protein n=1 Tax=Parabacteroides sp. Marseille-P3160 TaxID=1917887 RepID=UPI00135A7D72|nr:DUF3244 domain-containing protein [Parabacteroides sp. Marseille-P3160]